MKCSATHPKHKSQRSEIVFWELFPDRIPLPKKHHLSISPPFASGSRSPRWLVPSPASPAPPPSLGWAPLLPSQVWRGCLGSRPRLRDPSTLGRWSITTRPDPPLPAAWDGMHLMFFFPSIQYLGMEGTSIG